MMTQTIKNDSFADVPVDSDSYVRHQEIIK